MRRLASATLGSLLIVVGLAGLGSVALGYARDWQEPAFDVAESVLDVAESALGTAESALDAAESALQAAESALALARPAPPASAMPEDAGPDEAPAAGPAVAPEPAAPTLARPASPMAADREERQMPVTESPAPAVATADPRTAPPPTTLLSAAPAPFLPVTRVVAPTISLAAEVVPASLVDQGGRLTWSVPAFKAGHAEATAGAGGLGNAVLLGHVTSRQAGNVFQRLDGARVGDPLLVFSGERQFDYRVVEVRTVGRTDVSVVQPGETPSVTLLTCTGLWLPMIRDYAQRLVVRAELMGAAAAVPPAPAIDVTAAHPLFDARFSDDRQPWPNDPRSTAWVAENSYHLLARYPGQFVAVGAPIGAPLGDVVVSGSFRKVGGPSGGGYGLIVGDQGPGRRDGIDQGGRYYVLEVGDRGELGVWRREDERWIDVIPWTPSPAVRRGGAVNDLLVRSIGGRLTFLVNGIEVVRDLDAGLPAGGGVGIFVGGDLNDVAVDRFSVRAPD